MHYEIRFSLDVKTILKSKYLIIYLIHKTLIHVSILNGLDLGFAQNKFFSFCGSSSRDITMAPLHTIRESIDWAREKL